MHRVTLVWPDGAVQKTWLRVTVKATANGGLASPDVFYFGNAVGEAGDGTSRAAASAQVTAGDETLVRNNPRTGRNPAPVTSRYDFNRDRLVNATDQMIVRQNKTAAATALRLITAPQTSPPAAAQMGVTAPAPVPDVRVTFRPAPGARVFPITPAGRVAEEEEVGLAWL